MQHPGSGKNSTEDIIGAISETKIRRKISAQKYCINVEVSDFDNGTMAMLSKCPYSEEIHSEIFIFRWFKEEIYACVRIYAYTYKERENYKANEGEFFVLFLQLFSKFEVIPK